MSRKKKNGLNAGKFIGFIGVALTAVYAYMLFSHFGSIRTELAGLIAARIVSPHMLCVAAALVFSLIGLIEQKRWCMFAASASMAVSTLFMPDYVYYVALPALFLIFAYAEMD